MAKAKRFNNTCVDLCVENGLSCAFLTGVEMNIIFMEGNLYNLKFTYALTQQFHHHLSYRYRSTCVEFACVRIFVAAMSITKNNYPVIRGLVKNYELLCSIKKNEEALYVLIQKNI